MYENRFTTSSSLNVAGAPQQIHTPQFVSIVLYFFFRSKCFFPSTPASDSFSRARTDRAEKAQKLFLPLTRRGTTYKLIVQLTWNAIRCAANRLRTTVGMAYTTMHTSVNRGPPHNATIDDRRNRQWEESSRLDLLAVQWFHRQCVDVEHTA